MPDKKEIVLQRCKNAIDYGEPIMDYSFYYEVIALLKEQEAVEPIYHAGIDWYQCGACRYTMTSGMHGVEFCAKCGRKVKWE